MFHSLRETQYCEDVTLVYKFNVIPMQKSHDFVAIVDKLSLKSMKKQRLLRVNLILKRKKSEKTSTTRLPRLTTKL